MGGATFFIKAEDVMNPESWSPEDFVTLLMYCSKLNGQAAEVGVRRGWGLFILIVP